MLIPGTSLVRVTTCEMCGLIALVGYITFLVCISCSRQFYRLCQHIVRLHRMLPVKGKLPCATKVNTFILTIRNAYQQ